MNRFAISALLLLTSCASMDMQGHDPRDYLAANPIENKVGPNGELISPPNCPNWRASPVTTYSNSTQGNFGCATTTNLGLMLVDPRDLERGSSGGYITPDATRSADAIRKYRAGDSTQGSTAATMPMTTMGEQ